MLSCSSSYHCLVRQSGKVDSVISFILKRKKLMHQQVNLPKGHRVPELELERSFPDSTSCQFTSFLLSFYYGLCIVLSMDQHRVNPKIYKLFILLVCLEF